MATACWCSSRLSWCPSFSEASFGPHHISTIHPEICDLHGKAELPSAQSPWTTLLGSGAPLCESRVTEIQPSVGSPGFMAWMSPCLTASCWSFISWGVFSTGSIKEMAELMEKPQPSTPGSPQGDLILPGISYSCSSWEGCFRCPALNALVLSGVSANEKLAWPGPWFLNLQVFGIIKWQSEKIFLQADPLKANRKYSYVFMCNRMILLLCMLLKKTPMYS